MRPLRRTLARAVGVIALFSLVMVLLPRASLASTAQLYASGDDYYGQLGSTVNNETDNPNPTLSPVNLPGASGDISQMAVGSAHSMVVTSSGQLYAFGLNSSEQLGIAANAGTPAANPTPATVTLPGATGAVSDVSAADNHTLAVTSTGQLYAFGNNWYGQLGSASGNGTNALNGPTLVTLPKATGPVVQAAAGENFSLALTSTGQLYAFGENNQGQLGKAANFAANPTPTLVTFTGATGPIVRIAAGVDHVLALTSTGELFAFGANYDGQLGTSTNSGTSTANPTPIKIALPGASGAVTQIAAGDSHSLAVTSTGQLYAFGWNGRGQLGTTTNSGTDNPNPTPTTVTLPGEVGTVTAVAAGAFHSLAVTSSGQLYAFGGNRRGQLGLTVNAGTNNPNPTPALVPLPAGYSAVDVAQGFEAEHSLVLLQPQPAPITSPIVATPAVTPALVGLRVSPARYRIVGRRLKGRCVQRGHVKRVHKTCRRAIKLRISYSLNVRDAVAFTVERMSPGRLVRGHCVARRGKRHGQRCRALVTLRGIITRMGAAGANSVVWNGTIGGHKLGPGTFRLVAKPRGGASRKVTFTIVR